jgi:hypothetical protein
MTKQEALKIAENYLNKTKIPYTVLGYLKFDQKESFHKKGRTNL